MKNLKRVINLNARERRAFPEYFARCDALEVCNSGPGDRLSLRGGLEIVNGAPDEHRRLCVWLAPFEYTARRVVVLAVLLFSLCASASVQPHSPAGDVGLDAIVETLVAMESDGRADAVGDSGRGVGVLQIWPITVREANRIAGRNVWQPSDRLDPLQSRNMCRVILLHRARWHRQRYGRRATAWELIKSWNSSRTDRDPKPHYWPRFVEVSAR